MSKTNLNTNTPHFFDRSTSAPAPQKEKPQEVGPQTSGVTSVGETSPTQEHNTAGETQSSENQSEALGTGDQDETQAPQSHESPANTVAFEGAVSTKPSAPQPMALQSWNDKESIYADPAVSKLMEFVRDLEDKNFEQMMDMMQQSLDHAREMVEQAQEQWINVGLPQKQAMEATLQQMDQAKSAATEIASESNGTQHQAQQLESLVGNIQNQLHSNSALFTDASNSNLQSLMQAAQKMSQAIKHH